MASVVFYNSNCGFLGFCLMDTFHLYLRHFSNMLGASWYCLNLFFNRQSPCLVFWVSMWALTYFLEHASNGNLIGRAFVVFGPLCFIWCHWGSHWCLLAFNGEKEIFPSSPGWMSLSGEGMWWDPFTGALNCLVSQGRRRVWGPWGQ